MMRLLCVSLLSFAFTCSAQSNNQRAAPAPTEQTEAQLQIQRGTLKASVDADVMRGYKALGQNQFSQAREAYSQVLASNPTQRDALLGIAYAHQALGNTDQALSTLRRLIELYPRDSDGMSALYLIGGGDLVAEETRFKQLLDRTEYPASVHYTLGVIYFEQRRFGEADGNGCTESNLVGDAAAKGMGDESAVGCRAHIGQRLKAFSVECTGSAY